jgi:hypothetical protein
MLPGWQAFLIAFDTSSSNPVSAGIRVVSAVTNFLMLFAVALPVRRPNRAPARWLVMAFVAATAIDLWWASDNDRADMRIGYWLWAGSFALTAVALWVARKRAMPRREYRADAQSGRVDQRRSHQQIPS